jgi:hypothetical protein
MRLEMKLLLLMALAVTAMAWVSSAGGETAESDCVKTQRVILERGQNRSGEHWKVAAGIRANTGCATWLLSLEVAPSGTRRGTWRWGRAIPPNGSLPADFGIAAGDEVARVGRAFSGMTSGATRSVLLRTWKGRTIVIHPKRPTITIRRHHKWLRNLKYVVRFYPRGDHVRVVEGYGAGHARLFKVAGSEGAFEGP